MGVTIGPALKELLADKNWTQTRLAEEAGMKREDVNKIVNGFPVGKQRHARLLKPFGLTPEDVPGIAVGEEPPPSLSDRLRSLEAVVDEQGREMTAALKSLATEVRAANTRTELADPPATRTANR